jgi:MFS family permease
MSAETSNSPAVRLSVFAPQYRPITLSTLTLLALAAFDGMAISAALPKIGADLGVVRLPWVLTAFQLTSTVSMLAAGPIIDAIGVRSAYRFTLVVFFVTSLLCTLAPNLPTLIAARTLQGVGGGIVMAVTIANVGISYPAELRSRALAANSSVWGTMALAGPAVVAFLLSHVSWRGVFFINLPLVAFAALIGWSRLPDAEQRHAIDFDVRGLMTVSAVVVALLVGLAELNRWSVVALVVAIAFAAGYWRHSGSSAAPVLARRHFASWPFGALNAIPFAFFAGSLAVDSYLPIYVQGALGRSSAVAAFTVAFLAIGWTIGSQIVSRLLDRVRNVDVIVAGFIITMPSMIAGVFVYTDHAPLGLVLMFSFFQGLGIGSVTNATLSLLQRTAPAAEMGRASAAHQFMRQLGGTLGTAAAGAVLFGVVSARIGGVGLVRDLLGGKEIELASETRSAIAAGFRGAAVVALALTTVSFMFAIAVRRRFLRSDESRI